MAFRTLSTLQDLAGFYLREKGNILEGLSLRLYQRKAVHFSLSS